jgi:hypothetical protein
VPKMASGVRTISPPARKGSCRKRTVKLLKKTSPQGNETTLSSMNKVQIVRTLSDVPMRRLYLPLSKNIPGPSADRVQMDFSRRPTVRRRIMALKRHRYAHVGISSSPQVLDDAPLPSRRHGLFTPPWLSGTHDCLIILPGPLPVLELETFVLRS